MDEKLLLRLINSNFSASQICDELSMNYKDLFCKINELKTKGIFYYPYYDSKGEIFYTTEKINADDPITINPDHGRISFVSLSDIHIGSVYDDEKRLYEIQNYVLFKDLHFILNSGDNIDGFPKSKDSFPRRISSIDKQAEEFIRVYPQASELVTICALGDHDLRSRLSGGMSFNEYLRKNRHDIKVYSSGYGIIKIANKEIMLCHNANDPRIKEKLTDNMILIGGHSHYFDKNIYSYGKGLAVRIINPSVSRLPEINGFTSGFLRWDFDISGNIVTCIHVQEYVFDENNKIKEGSLDHFSLVIGNNNTRTRKKFH